MGEDSEVKSWIPGVFFPKVWDSEEASLYPSGALQASVAEGCDTVDGAKE
jgi:hypothetical protein